MKEYNLQNRRYIIAGLIIVITIIYIIRLFNLQVADETYKKNADSNAFLRKTIYPSRGMIYDRNGKLIEIMYGYYDSGDEDFVPTYSSVYTDINSLPKYVGDAFTAIEDETFYDNSGISVNRLLYATFNYLLKGDSSFCFSSLL